MQYQKNQILRFNDCVTEYTKRASKWIDWIDFNQRFNDSRKFCTHAKYKIRTSGSGAPLIVDSILIGVSSWSCCYEEHLPNVYTNVYGHLRWIYDEMSK